MYSRTNVQRTIYKQHRHDLVYQSRVPNELALQAQLACTISYLPDRLLVHELVTTYRRVRCVALRYSSSFSERMHAETFGLQSLRLRLLRLFSLFHSS